MKRITPFAALITSQILWSMAAQAASVIVSSSTFDVPQDVIQAPTGGYLVADTLGQAVYRVNDGSIQQTLSFSSLNFDASGFALLSSYYGADQGQYIVVGRDGTSTSPYIGEAALLGTDGLTAPTSLITVQNAFLTTTATVPTGGYGSAPAGALFVASELSAQPNMGSIQILNPDLSGFTTFETLPFEVYGLAFAPSDFGMYAGDLFGTDAFTGQIFVILPDGTTQLFATLPLPTGFNTPGLRQITFAPAGFFTVCGANDNAACPSELVVSVASQNHGGGTNGAVEVLGDTGDLTAGYKYLQGDSGSPLDPRGLLIGAVANNIIVSNADPGLNQIAATDFVTADQFLPEPSALAVMLSGLAGLGGALRRRRRRG